MPPPRKLPPPDPAEVKKLAKRMAVEGPMPWTLAVHKAEESLRAQARAANRPVSKQFAKSVAVHNP